MLTSDNSNEYLLAVTADLISPNGKYNLVIATTLLAMGVDMKGQFRPVWRRQTDFNLSGGVRPKWGFNAIM